VIGAVLWVVGFVGAGALFGNIPIVRNNFSKVILIIIVVSVLPIAWEAFGAWRAARRERLRAAAKAEG